MTVTPSSSNTPAGEVTKIVTMKLTGAWEIWRIRVPEGTTDEEILAGTVDFKYDGVEDAGFDDATATSVENE